MLSAADVRHWAKELMDQQDADRHRLNVVRLYWKGRQRLPAVVPTTAPAEVREMARIARVNVCDTVVSAQSQSVFVEGFRGAEDRVNAAVWQAWERNRMSKWQMGLHSAAIAYGSAYTTVLPGIGGQVIRPHSPRQLTAVYDDDPDWPFLALERRPGGGYRLYDDEAWYPVGGGVLAGEPVRHGMGVTPVVRYTTDIDLDLADEPPSEQLFTGGRSRADDVVAGQVAPMMDQQDQIDLITFNLLVAQHYSAFRQRYAIGWLAESETQKMKAAASQLWTFEDHPDEMRLGEFEQTDLTGYISSREASLKYAATLSQTPVHELVGELVNLSAEALAAAEAGRDRLIDSAKTSLGESHEQTMQLVGAASGLVVPDDAQTIWRDTSARAFGAVVDGLGKLATMLGVPPQELWEQIPGVTQTDIRRWRQTAAQGDALGRLEELLERQADGGGGGGGVVAPEGVPAGGPDR